MGQSSSTTTAVPLQSCHQAFTVCDPRSETVKVDLAAIQSARDPDRADVTPLATSKGMRAALKARDRQQNKSAHCDEPDRAMLAKMEWERNLKAELDAREQKTAEDDQNDERAQALAAIRRELDTQEPKESNDDGRQSDSHDSQQYEDERLQALAAIRKDADEGRLRTPSQPFEVVQLDGLALVEFPVDTPQIAFEAIREESREFESPAPSPCPAGPETEESDDGVAKQINYVESAQNEVGPAAAHRREILDAFLAENSFTGINSKRRKLFRTTYPLHVAADQGDARIVEFLLAEGADSTQKNSSGQTPAQVAQRRNSKESHACVLRLLATSQGNAQESPTPRFAGA